MFPLTAGTVEIGGLSVNAEGMGIAGSKIEPDKAGAGGEVEVLSGGISVSMPVRFNEQFGMDISLSGNQTAYNWTNPERIFFSNGREPWDDLYSSQIGINFSYHFDKTWSMFFGGNFGAAWEKQTDDAYQYGANIGVAYNLSDHKTFILGAAYQRLPEKNELMPIFGFSWNMKGEEKSGWSFSIGVPQTEIRYSFNEMFDISCNLSGNRGTYRLDEENKVSPSGLLEIKEFGTGIVADIYFSESVKLSGGVTYYFDREWNLQDKNGNTIRKIDIENAFGGKVVLSVSF